MQLGGFARGDRKTRGNEVEIGDQDMFYRCGHGQQKQYVVDRDGRGVREDTGGECLHIKGFTARLYQSNRSCIAHCSQIIAKKVKRASEHDVTDQQNTTKKSNTEVSNVTTKTYINTINRIVAPKVMNVASPETENKQIRTRENCQTRAGATDKNLQKSKKCQT